MRIVGKFHEEVFSDPNTATGLNKVRATHGSDTCCVMAYNTPNTDSPSISRQSPNTTMTN